MTGWKSRSFGSTPSRPSDSSRSQRSEEHTSELQSQSNLVCRLLLEKKKNHYIKLLCRRMHHQPIHLVGRFTRCSLTYGPAHQLIISLHKSVRDGVQLTVDHQ